MDTTMNSFTFMYRPSDFDASVAFFRDRIGLEIVSSWDDDGRGVIFAAGAGRIELFWDPDPAAIAHERPHRPTVATSLHHASLSWEVEDVAKLVGAWREAAVEITSQPASTPWGTRMAVAQGPDGLLMCPYDT